jgi:putative ABC transport system permease protein
MLKALGASDLRLAGMALPQADMAGGVGYGLGVGLTAAWGEATRGHTKQVFHMHWQVLLLTGVAVSLVTGATSVLRTRRVIRLDPPILVR